MRPQEKMLVLRAMEEVVNSLDVDTLAKGIVNLQGGLNIALAHEGKDPEQVIKACKEFIAQGNKLQAVKLYKDFSGLGLKEAKDFVDSL